MIRLRPLAALGAALFSVTLFTGASQAAGLQGFWHGIFDAAVYGQTLFEVDEFVPNVARRGQILPQPTYRPSQISGPVDLIIDWHEGDLLSGYWNFDDGSASSGVVCARKNAGEFLCSDDSGIMTLTETAQNTLRFCYAQSVSHGFLSGCATVFRQ